MYMECRHIKTNGLRCQSPALQGGHFCYYHTKIRTVGAEPNLKYGPLQLPPPEDPAAIQLSVARINDAIINGRLDLKKAAGLLNGIRLAAKYIDPKKYFYAPGTVHSAEPDCLGDELAPVNFVCKDEEDCNGCPYADLCPRCVRPGDEREVDREEDDDDDDEDDEDDE